MSRTSVTILPNTQDNVSLTGTPVRADGWCGFHDRLYTVAVHVSNFQGTVHIEASLAAEPTETDWFDAIEPLKFPRTAMATGETAAVGSSFRGNYVWLRARMERDDLGIAPDAQVPISMALGFVDRILLNH